MSRMRDGEPSVFDTFHGRPLYPHEAEQRASDENVERQIDHTEARPVFPREVKEMSYQLKQRRLERKDRSALSRDVWKRLATLEHEPAWSFSAQGEDQVTIYFSPICSHAQLQNDIQRTTAHLSLGGFKVNRFYSDLDVRRESP